MKQHTHHAVQSPCINLCVMQSATEAATCKLPVPLCKGCARTIAEIAAWGSMNDEDKCLVLLRLPARRLQLASFPAGQ